MEGDLEDWSVGTMGPTTAVVRFLRASRTTVLIEVERGILHGLVVVISWSLAAVDVRLALEDRQTTRQKLEEAGLEASLPAATTT